MGVTDEGAHVVVSGLPGSGKSTLAAALGIELQRAVVSRDPLLAILLESLGGVGEVDDATRSLAQSIVSRLLLHLLSTLPPVIADGGWWTNRHEPDLLSTGRDFIQVFCACSVDVARSRIRDRNRWDSALLDDNYERFAALQHPLQLPGALVVVDTELPVDVRQVAARIRTVE